MNNMEPRAGQKYVDEYGQIWEVRLGRILDGVYLWKEDTGMGLWDEGRGLTRFI